MRIPGAISRHSKLIFRVIGTAGLLASLYFIVVGIFCLTQDSTSPDEEGYFSNWIVNIRRESHAVILRPDDTVFGSAWERIELPDFKVEVTGNNPSKEIFIGAASEDSINSYLSGVEYDEITSLAIFPGGTKYVNSFGTGSPESPARRSFWYDSAYGTEKQTLKWSPGSGNQHLVIMNSDGSAGMDIRLVIGAKVALLFLTGIGDLMLGTFLLLLSLFILFYTRRTRSTVYPPPLVTTEKKEEET